MVTDLKNTGKRKRIYTKHKITTSETDNILLSDKKHKRKKEDTPIVIPLIYLLNIQARIRPFNHKKGHTQVKLTILVHLKFLRNMIP